MGRVEGWDDTSQQFLITFSDEFPKTVGTLLEDDSESKPFAAFEKTPRKNTTTTARSNQQKFKFQVMKRYGPQCAVCSVSVPELLQGAHIIPKEYHGSDDPRNGLLLCANHHLAFDAGLFLIRPTSFAVEPTTNGPNKKQLKIEFDSISHLKQLPNCKPLEWRWNHL